MAAFDDINFVSGLFGCVRKGKPGYGLGKWDGNDYSDRNSNRDRGHYGNTDGDGNRYSRGGGRA